MKKLGGKRQDGPQVPLSEVTWEATGPQPKPGVNKARVIALITVAGIGGLVVTAGLLPNAAVGVAVTSQVLDAWNLQSNTIPAEALPGRTTIVTDKGAMIAEVFSVNRVPATAEGQGKNIREAVVSIEELGRHGARCRDCSRSVSPYLPPNPPCVSLRNGLSARLARCQAAVAVSVDVHGVGILLPR